MTTLTDEHRAFADSVRALMADVSPTSTTRSLMAGDDGFDPDTWERVAKTGLTGLHVPEAYGGQGSGTLELVIAMHEMGRALFCGPFLGTTCLATTAILDAASENAKQRLLPALTAGSRRATLATSDGDGSWDLRRTTVSFHHGNDGVRVAGLCPYVVDGHTADQLVVPARDTGGGVALLLVRKDADGVERALLPTVDRTRKLAKVRLTDAPAEVISDDELAPSALDLAADTATLCLAAESVGAAERCLEMATEYAKVRTAFGRPIGAFQALKHKAADHYISVEQARTLTHAAATAMTGSDFALLVSLAKAAAGEAYEQVAFDNIVMHGGIGFTWEHDAHLYLRRAHSSAKLLGDVPASRQRAADLLLPS